MFPTKVYQLCRSIQCSSRVDKAYLAFLEESFHASCLKTACKTATISPKGGSIELYGYKLIFPAGAVKLETDVEITVDNNPDLYPKTLMPVSLIIGCKPYEFRKPVKVRLASWFRSRDGHDIKVTILSRATPEMEWESIRKATLTKSGFIEYEVLHFSKHAAGVSDEEASDGSIHFFNDVWMKNTNAFILSFLCKDQKSVDDYIEKLVPDHSRIISLPTELDIPLNGSIEMKISCLAPPGMKMISKCSRPITITKTTLKSCKIDCYFKPDPHPSKMNHFDEYDLEYAFEIKDAQQKIDEETSRCGIPLSYAWRQTEAAKVKELGEASCSHSAVSPTVSGQSAAFVTNATITNLNIIRSDIGVSANVQRGQPKLQELGARPNDGAESKHRAHHGTDDEACQQAENQAVCQETREAERQTKDQKCSADQSSGEESTSVQRVYQAGQLDDLKTSVGVKSDEKNMDHHVERTKELQMIPQVNVKCGPGSQNVNINVNSATGESTVFGKDGKIANTTQCSPLALIVSSILLAVIAILVYFILYDVSIKPVR